MSYEAASSLPAEPDPFVNRLEYDAVAATDPMGDVAVVIDAIDDIMERAQATEDVSFRTDGQRIHYLQTFRYLSGDLQSFVWPLVEQTVSLEFDHRPLLDQVTYRLTVGWLVHQSQITQTDNIQTIYEFQCDASGPVSGTVKEPDILDVPGKLTERPITRFDWSKLFNLMAEIEVYQTVPTSERTMAEAVWQDRISSAKRVY